MVEGNPAFKGKSVSVFNPTIARWQQTWVDNQGSYLDFTGQFSDGKMILSRPFLTTDGKKIFSGWSSIIYRQILSQGIGKSLLMRNRHGA